MEAKHELGALIQAVQDANGWSDRDLANRADRLGLDIAKSNFSRLKNQPLVSIKGSLIKGLALVLDVSDATVARAALAAMGVEATGRAVTVEEALSQEPDLSARDRRVLLAALSVMTGRDDV